MIGSKGWGENWLAQGGGGHWSPFPRPPPPWLPRRGLEKGHRWWQIKLNFHGGGGGSSGGIYVRLERNTQFGFSSVADLDPSSREALFTVTGSGRMVAQQATGFLVGGLNPGQMHMPAAPPTAFTSKDWNRQPQKLQLAALPFDTWVVVVRMCIPIAWSLLTTNYYTMPWGMLRE